MIKQLLAGVVVLLMVVGIETAEAAQTYVLSVQNEAVNGTSFSFDIFIRRTGDPMDLGDSDLSLRFNDVNFASPGASAVSSLSGYATGAAILPGSPKMVIVNITAPVAGPFAVPTSDTKVATVTITNISNPSGTAGLTWVAGPPTIVQTYLGDDIMSTDPGAYQNPLIDLPLPITLASFAAKINLSGQGVKLEWGTISEVNNYGCYVQRRLASDSLFTEIPNSFVAGHGTTLEGQHYTYTDGTVGPGQWSYRLRQIDLDGTARYSEPVSVDLLTGVKDKEIPEAFALRQNYPNPFNPSTRIRYDLTRATRVSLKVFNMLGQEVTTLVDEMQEAGYRSVEFQTSGMASGVYLFRLQAGTFIETRKMIVVK